MANVASVDNLPDQSKKAFPAAHADSLEFLGLVSLVERLTRLNQLSRGDEQELLLGLGTVRPAVSSYPRH